MRLHALYWNYRIGLSVLVTVLLLLLSACGEKSATGTGSSSVSTSVSPTSAARTVQGYGTSHGCPSDVVVSISPSAATVVTQPGAINQSVTAHVGDVVEVRAPLVRNGVARPALKAAWISATFRVCADDLPMLVSGVLLPEVSGQRRYTLAARLCVMQMKCALCLLRICQLT